MRSRTRLVLAIALISAGAGGALPAQAAEPVLTGYAWPEHTQWSYRQTVDQTMAIRVVAPESLLTPTGGYSATATTESETFRIVMRFHAPVSIRTGAVKDGGLYVQMVVASAPLSTTITGPGIGTQAETATAPSLTISGRLASNGDWIPIAVTAHGGNLPGGGGELKSLIKSGLMGRGSLLVPIVPKTGFQVGRMFHRTILSNPARLLNSALDGVGLTTPVKAGTWALSSVNTPSLNAKGNWVIMSRIDTPTPLTASFSITIPDVGKGRVTMTDAMTGDVRTVLDRDEGGRLLRSIQEASVTGQEVDTFSHSNVSPKPIILREEISGQVRETLIPTPVGQSPTA
jgi:hypothetical protein